MRCTRHTIGLKAAAGLQPESKHAVFMFPLLLQAHWCSQPVQRLLRAWSSAVHAAQQDMQAARPRPPACLLLPSSLGTTLAIIWEAKAVRCLGGGAARVSRFWRDPQNSASDSTPPCTSCRHRAIRALHRRKESHAYLSPCRLSALVLHLAMATHLLL